ncbi:MAG: hypothetical protein MUP11_04310 [Anaerolineales bacterium]|nr:hypothetical protein [Anaerolineales bacterium]
MTTLNWLIQRRENTLNTLLRVNPSDTLNTGGSKSKGVMADRSLAAEIKKSLNHLKSLAVSGDG